MRKIILIGTLLISVSCSAQVLQKINSYGYEWKKGQFDSSIVPPRDTLVKPLLSDSGATAYKKGILYIWNGYKWVADFSNVLSIRSVTGNGVVGTELKLVNDTAMAASPNLPYYYGSDTTGRLGYAENKYVVAKKASELRNLRSCDTAHIYRLMTKNAVMDYRLVYGDASSADDSVTMLVTTSGQRLAIYNPDGIVDIRWWGAKCDNSQDESLAVNAALRWIGNQPINLGGVIRLPGVTRLDGSSLVYPNRRITFIFQNVQLITQWEIPYNVNLVGMGGAASVAALGRGNPATISVVFQDTTKAALHMTGDGGYYSDFSLIYPAGKGIYIDGIPGTSVTARKVFDRISVQTNTGNAGIPVYIDHAFWIWFNQCAFANQTGNNYSVVLKNSRSGTRPAGKTDFGYTGLIYFDNTIITGKGIYLTNDSANGHGVGSVFVKNMMYESGTGSMFILNSTKDAILNLRFENIAIADPISVNSYINNTGSATNGVYVKGDILDGTIVGGSTIFNLQVNGSPLYTSYPIGQAQVNPSYNQNSNIYGYINAINANKGFANTFLKTPYTNAGIKNDPTTWTLRTITATGGFLAPDGTNSAYKVSSPSGEVQYDFYYNTTFYADSADWIFAGVWVKPSVATGTTGQLPTVYIEDSSGNPIAYAIQYKTRPLIQTNQGWMLTTGAIKVPKKLNNNGIIDFLGTTIAGNPYYVYKPFLYRIPAASLGLNDEEVLSWCREMWGAVPGAPAGSVAIGNDNPIYIGADTAATKWDNVNKKWYQNTTIPYTSTDSFAVLTFREGQRRYGTFPTLQQTITQGNVLTKNDTINASTYYLYLQGTSALGLPSGTTAQRPTAITGMMRFNTDSAEIERYNGTAWSKLSGSGGGTPTYFINSKLGDTTFRTTGPGLAANTIQWKGLIPGSGMNSVTTDSTIKYNWGGTLANATAINNNGFTTTYSGTGTIAISGGNYNGSLGSTWQMNGATINNAVTAASGTVAKAAQASIGGSTFTASNTGVTYTNAATFYVDGPPTAGTNVTITNPYTLYINGGNSYFGGTVYENNVNNGGSTLTFAGTGVTALSGGNYNNTIGSTLQVNGATVNNGVTAASGTVATYGSVSLGQNTLTATNTGVTYTNASSLYLAGAPTASTNVTITNPYTLYSAAGRIHSGGDIDLPHIRGNSFVTTATLGTGAGTGATSTYYATANDAGGFLTVTTGTTPAASAAVITVNFATAYANNPFVVITPGNGNASALSGANQVYITTTTTGFTINAGSAALAASLGYQWYYHVIQ